MEKEFEILAISAAIFVVLIILALFIDNFAVSSNMVFIGIGILIGPYSLYKFLELKKIRSYEEKFPVFLREISESQRSGMTAIQAIHMAAKSDYGSLSEEIKKIDNQLSWNVTLAKVLAGFGKRMKKSKTISRSVSIIEQANKSGGSVEDTMDSLAENIESIKELQEEKGSLMSQQVIMMYAIFFIFLFISVSLIKFLIPMLNTQFGSQSETAIVLPVMGGFSTNPCYTCISEKDPSCMSCDIFFAVSASFGFGEREDPGSYYKALFFSMTMIQGFFCGLLAGQIGSDSIVAGLKHSMIMLLSGTLMFMAVIKIGFI